MKFSGDIDMDLRHTYKCIVTMDINLYGFYGNISKNILSNLVTYYNVTQKLFDQSSWNFQGK